MQALRERDEMYVRAGQGGELIPYMAGHELCRSGHSWGPGIRDYYLLHYIRKGRGVFRANGREYHLSAGQVFFIFPENISHYIADDADPWEYYWIGFGGGKAALLLGQAGVVLENPILTCKE
ncbi:MAG: AraC family ligand binding domain-containing protein, partial [Candidatus Omnitrophota bacterium]